MGTDWNGDGKVDWQDTAWESFDDEPSGGGGGGGGNNGGCLAEIIGFIAVIGGWILARFMVYYAAGLDFEKDDALWADIVGTVIFAVVLLVILGLIQRNKK